MTTHPSFQPHREVVLAGGYRSMQATPLMRQNGSGCIGVICTCFLQIYTPPSDVLETLDLYAEIAATYVDQHQRVAELVRRDSMLTEVVEKQNEIFRRIGEHLNTIEQRALSLDPEEIRSLARFISEDIGLARANLHVTQPLTQERPEPGEDSDAKPYGLTSRELGILVHVWRGLSDRQIALKLGISRFTVAKHLGTAMRKLNVRTRTQSSVIVEREALHQGFAEN
jgi:DNA-binding CsgD family transcriptional regulator